jgi:4-amino-4-deoxy-L-arabinose transferase-like glycosyltransferase
MPILTGLPFLFFALVYVALRRQALICLCRRDAVMMTALVWATTLAAMTNALSAFVLLTSELVIVCWAAASAIGLALVLWVRGRYPARSRSTSSPSRAPALAPPLIGIGAIVVATGMTALAAPPNTWDSMTYHMPRIAHWIENRHVGFYPTHIPRQLHLNPWAEYAILHLQLLSLGDRWANLIQWFSMLGSLCGVTLIARELGADARAQVLAAIVAVTLPMGILQASSTQTDYVVSLWLVGAVYYGLRLRTQPHWANSFALGGCLGLAILTKATAYLYALPFLIWFAIGAARSLRRRAWKPALIVVLVVLTLNLPHYARNFELYGSPLGPSVDESGARFANQEFSLAILASNIARNLTLHLATPYEPANHAIDRAVRRLHQFLGVGVDDPRTTWFGWAYEVRFWMHEDYAGNPAHLGLLLTTGAGCLLYAPLRHRRPLLHYLAAISVAALLFVGYLQWQPWHSRLHLPLFVLAAPIAAIALAAMPWRKAIPVVSLALILCALPWVMANVNRPLLGSGSVLTTSRTDQYFTNQPKLREPYFGAARYLLAMNCTQIGVLAAHDDWEYPLWVLLQTLDGRRLRIEHVLVSNGSSVKAAAAGFSTFEPCAIVSLNPRLNAAMLLGDYHRQWSSDPVTVFVRR